MFTNLIISQHTYYVLMQPFCFQGVAAFVGSICMGFYTGCNMPCMISNWPQYYTDGTYVTVATVLHDLYNLSQACLSSFVEGLLSKVYGTIYTRL